MKLEQIYKDIYEALNVGDKLWADETFSGLDLDRHLINFFKNLYYPDFEPNTIWEDALLRTLKKYFHENTGAKDLGKLLKGLLPLKSKFPRLLDPAQSQNVKASGAPWQTGYEEYAWRGATMKLSELQKLIPQSNLIGQANEKDPKRIRIDGFSIDNPNFVYKSRGGYGFTSFSLDAHTADAFKGQFDDDRVSVVYGVKLTNPNLIMNPDVSNLLSTYKEYETLYVGDSVKPDVIMVTDRRIKDQFKDDARTSKTPNPLAYFDDWKRTAKLQPPSKYVGLKPEPPLKEPTSSTSSLLKKQAAKYNKMKSLEEIYTEIRLSEVGNLEPSKALPFRMTMDTTTLGNEGEVLGKQFYRFKLDDGTEMMAEVSYGNGAAIINFNSVEGAKQGKTPIIGGSYKSAYAITNTIGTILKHSLKDTLKHGKTFEIVVYGKPEWQKKNPFQRQEIYNLFLQKAFPGATTNKSTLITTLPDNYTKYLNENKVYTEIQLSEGVWSKSALEKMKRKPMEGRYFITDEEGNMLGKGLKTQSSVRAYFYDASRDTGYLKGKMPKVVNVHDNKKGGEVVNQYFWGGRKGIIIDKFPSDQYGVINPQYVKYKDELNEIGEGSSEPFEYKENFRKGDTFSYMIDAYTEQDDLERSIPIRLQAIAYKERVSDDMEMDREEYFEFLDKPKGTIINGYEIIFSIADAAAWQSFNLVNDRVYMFRLMATIKEILQKEFGSNPPDLLNYSPTKEGSEAVEDTGRHKLYSIFIKKAFPNAKMFVSDVDEEIYFKLK